MKNCITVAIAARLRFGHGKFIIISWSGAWRKQEWPPMPHIGLKIDDRYIVHYQADSRNLQLWKMLDFEGKVKIKRIC